MFGLPMTFMNMLWWVHQRTAYVDILDGVENFSGVGNVHRAFENAGLKMALYDIDRDEPYENMLTPEGSLTSVQMNARIGRAGLSHWATVCSSWVRVGL
eukprot:8131839-Alexandrium_andersonii.AAC.1